MPHTDLRERIAGLTSLDAPVGFEEPVLQLARNTLTLCCESVEMDVRGNVYGYQPGSDADAPLVMITAHADEIGFMVTHILPGGYLRFDRLGWPTHQVLPGQRIRVLSRTGPLEGVIGVKPGHILSPQEAKIVPEVQQMYLDVGASSAEEVAAWGVEPGTPVVFVGDLTPTRNPNRCFGKCVDNRIGIASVLAAAETLQHESLPASVAYVITVEEEINLRGAFVAGQHVQPDAALIIDTVPAGGTPDLAPDALPWEIGKGPLLKVRETRGLSTHRPLRELLRETAETAGIPYQLIVDTAGVTDASAIQQAGGNIAAAVIGLARKYSHSAVEMFDLSDVQHIIDLVCATTRSLTSKSQLFRL